MVLKSAFWNCHRYKYYMSKIVHYCMLGTVAGKYDLRRLQIKRCGRLGQGPSSRLTIAQQPYFFIESSVRVSAETRTDGPLFGAISGGFA